MQEFQAVFENFERMQDSILKLAVENTDESNRKAGDISMGEAASVVSSLLEKVDNLNKAVTDDLRVSMKRPISFTPYRVLSSCLERQPF